MAWNVTMARYSPKINMVKERRVLSGLDWKEAEDYVNNNATYPIYTWSDCSAYFDNPTIGMIETESCREEYRKVID